MREKRNPILCLFMALCMVFLLLPTMAVQALGFTGNGGTLTFQEIGGIKGLFDSNGDLVGGNAYTTSGSSLKFTSNFTFLSENTGGVLEHAIALNILESAVFEIPAGITVSITAGNAANGSSIGINLSGTTLTVRGEGTLEVQGGSASAGSQSAGITGDTLIIESGVTVRAVGGVGLSGSFTGGIQVDNLTVNGGSLLGIGGVGDYSSTGIAAHNIVITGGAVVTAEAGPSLLFDASYGINIINKMDIISGTVTAQGYDRAISSSEVDGYPVPEGYAFWVNTDMASPSDMSAAGRISTEDPVFDTITEEFKWARIQYPPDKSAMPTASPSGGTFTDSVSVTLSTTTPGAEIFFTTDGSTPVKPVGIAGIVRAFASGSNLYMEEIVLTETTTINAISTFGGKLDSEVLTVTFTRQAADAEEVGGNNIFDITEDTVAEYDRRTPYFTVTFNTNGGNEIPSQRVARGDSVKRPNNPIKDGYNFEGWYADSELTIRYDFNAPVNGRITIHARWTDASSPPIFPALTEEHISYIQGYPDGTVRPDNSITRAEAASIFFRLIDSANKYMPLSSAFSDVLDGAWYAQAVAYLQMYNTISGYPDGTFAPDSPITRAEFAVICSRFDNLETNVPNVFSDVDDSHWAIRYINSAAARGWVSGFPDGTFRPDEFITRAQVVTLVNRMLNRRIHLHDLPYETQIYNDIDPSHWAYTDIIEASFTHTFTRRDDGYEIWTHW